MKKYPCNNWTNYSFSILPASRSLEIKKEWAETMYLDIYKMRVAVGQQNQNAIIPSREEA